MNRQYAALFSLLLMATISSLGADSRQGLVEALRLADGQRDALRALIDNKEVNLEKISIEDVGETIKKLEAYREQLLALEQDNGKLAEQEKRFLLLAEELIRQLVNARMGYQQRINSNASVKKIAVSVGAAAAVFGGLMLLNFVTPLDISVTTAALCGIVTGCVVGVITHIDALVKNTSHAASLVAKNVPASSPFGVAIKTVATIGVAAAATAFLYSKRGVLLRRLPAAKESLSAAAERVGL